MDPIIYLLFILVLSIFLGFALISKVPPLLHTPLMSEANAICGIIIIGALISAGAEADSTLTIILGTSAVALATFNVVGGYLVTERMLKMFKKKETTK
jgi:H+-translocating NAD(P) transhydrogenase subunit alpha